MGCSSYITSRAEKVYAKAIAEFERIPNFKDAQAQIDMCKQIYEENNKIALTDARKEKTKKKKTIIRICVVAAIIVLAWVLVKMVIPT